MDNQIELMRKVSKLNKELYTASLLDKEQRSGLQTSLKEIYKPLLGNQEEQLKTQNKLHQEQLTAQQRNHREIVDNTRSENIIHKKEHAELINKIQKQPLIIPIIKSLNDHPNLKEVLVGHDIGQKLTVGEKHILKELNEVDNHILKILIDYYSLPEKDQEQVIKLPPPVVSYEHHPSEIAALANLPPPYDEGEYSATNNNYSIYKNTYDVLKSKKNLRENLGFYLDGKVIRLRDYAVLFTNTKIKLENVPTEYEYTTGLIKLLTTPRLNVLTRSNNDITKDDIYAFLDIIKESGTDIKGYEEYISKDFPSTVKLNTALQRLGELDKYFPNAKPFTGRGLKKGYGLTQFLSSNPETLIKKLDVLMSEHKAGNNNVFNEISAITDELRRLGVLTIKHIKEIFKELIHK